MYRILTRFFAVAFAVLLVARVVPGVAVDGLYTALLVALVLGILNLIVRPILVILTLPITLLTFGLFLVVVNAGIFWLASSLVDGFTINGFLPALTGSLIVSSVSWLIHKLTK